MEKSVVIDIIRICDTLVDMMKDVFVWKIGGDAGQGQQVAGLILAKVCSTIGFNSFVYSDYPSRLRGGLVTNQVNISKKPIVATYRQIDLLFALNQEALDLNLNNLNKGALVFYDDDKVKNIPSNNKNINFHSFPVSNLLKQAEISKLTANNLILGVSLAVLGGDLNLLKKEIKKTFKGKNPEIIKHNQKAIQIGWNYAKELNIKNELVSFSLENSKKSGNDLSKADSSRAKMILTGNDAVSLGAVVAECKFYSAYPMTPATSILHNLAKWALKAGIIVKHTEDEISAVNMAIGASWGGVRAMTGTSGGGFALMTEGLALSGITEIPLVIVDSQRPGPATGLPTWTEQGDLQFVAKAGHGEFPRVVLAPGNVEQAFYQTILAFNLADKYQIPVFILLDKHISESYQTIPLLDLNKIKIDRGKILSESQIGKDYKRYVLVKDGVSPRSLPGQKNGMFIANSDEHDEYGNSIEGFQAEMRKKQFEKRYAKIKSLLKDLPKPKLFGPKKADLTLIGWGSVQGAVLEALKTLDKVNYLQLDIPYPLDVELLKRLLKDKKVIIIENNYTGQLADLMQEALGMKFEKRLNKYDGRQFTPEEIIEKVKGEAKGEG
ncbi:2-oxoacid:acceptor oxidoreductase subunit alpha [Patescibacteria group bacterium]